MFYSLNSITAVSQRLRAEGKQLVLVTGFFDLLHSEHVAFLKKAKEAGDILIVAVESDSRARQVKGEGRPIESQEVRCQHVSSYADYVIALGDDFDNQEAYESLIAAVMPHVYAVSSHTSFLENKQSLVAKYGGQLQVVHHWNPAISTSKIIEKGQKPL